MFDNLHRRSRSQSSGLGNPVSVTPSSSEQPALPHQGKRKSGSRLSSLPKFNVKAMLATPDLSKLELDKQEGGLPHEMIPVLTLLASHGSRIYTEGYFMILAELNNDGQPIRDRNWHEVYGTLQGTIITMWDAAQLEEGKYETSFINVADGYMRSVETLGPDLQNVIVLSTTMKNRFLLQFGTRKLFQEWTAALRLSAFERTSLQEAYTGALLSSKGSQLHGIRAMLSEAKYKTETWCNVRFGAGMPWKRVWLVITPSLAIKDKKERKKRGPLGKIEMFADPKDKKKRPLATIHRAFTAFAVFPEKSILMNMSSLIKLECFVEFEGDPEVRESAIFLMPEQHPGIQGVETLIRTLIPIYDVFQLYGRPKRLNADKTDLNSLLFGMPTLPRAYYLDVIDIVMLTALPDSTSWTAHDWNSKLKELIARKMSVGFKGSGSIHTSSPDSKSDGSIAIRSPRPDELGRAFETDRKRAISDPNGIPRLFSSNPNSSTTSVEGNSSNGSVNKYAPAVPSPLQHSRPAPKAPNKQPQAMSTSDSSGNISGSGTANNKDGTTGYQGPSITGGLLVPSTAPTSKPNHQRVKSEGEHVGAGLLTPTLGEMQKKFSEDLPDKHTSDLTVDSKESFFSVKDTTDADALRPDGGSKTSLNAAQQQQSPSKSNLFDPSYRPAHQSYAEYSEYMQQYLKGVGNSTSKSPNRDSPNKGKITTTVEVDELDASQLARPTTPSQPGSGGARLLDTPVRTPLLSQGMSPSSTVITSDASPLGLTATASTGSQIAIYPNAPGSSPRSKARSKDSLDVPKRPGGERRPSGPRPGPDSAPAQRPQQAGNYQPSAGPSYPQNQQQNYYNNNNSSNSVTQAAAPSRGGNPYTQSQPQPQPQGGPQYSQPPHSGPMQAQRPGPYQGQQPTGPPRPQGGYGKGPQDNPYAAPSQPPQGYNGQQPMYRGGPPPNAQPPQGGQPTAGYDSPYGMPSNGPQQPRGPTMTSERFLYAQPGMPRPYPPNANGPPLGQIVGAGGIPNNNPHFNNYQGGMPGGPRPMPPGGLRVPPNLSPYGPQAMQPAQNIPNRQEPPRYTGSAKTGPVLRPVNEIRAEQLRSTRAQAMGDGSYGR